MFGEDEEDFNLFDDKQVEKLDAPEKPAEDVEEPAEEPVADDTPADDTSASGDTKSDDEGTDDDTPSDVSDGEGSPEAGADGDKPDGEESGEAQVAPDDASPDQEEKFATKDDIRAALAEQAAIQEAQQTTRKSLRSELRSELFPEGIDFDLQIKDSDNGLITGPSQIAGKLVNPNTQELFTYEEAKDYWDNAQKQINKIIEEREQTIDSYAENNQSFFDGAQIVEQKYGAWLKANPVEAKKLLDNYFATAAKVTKSGYITEMTKDVVSYYDTVMSPLKSVASQLELKRQGEEQEQARQAQKASQSDRSDLPVSSTTTPPAKKDELNAAFGRYFEGK